MVRLLTYIYVLYKFNVDFGIGGARNRGKGIVGHEHGGGAWPCCAEIDHPHIHRGA